MGIVQELKERRLVQIVVSFATAGWIGLEVLNSLVERGVVPDLLYYVALVWYLGGLLAAVVVGWHHGEKGRQEVARGEVLTLSVIALASLAGSVVVVQQIRAAEEGRGAAALGDGSLSPTRLAVLYFDDRSADGSLSFLADGLTESLIGELAAVPLLDVVSENGAARFRGSGLPRDSIARALEVGTLVAGSVEPAGGDRVRVDFSIYEGVSGSPFNRGVVEEPRAELLDLNRELASEVSRMLREWLGAEIAVRNLSVETDNTAAWALFQRGEQARRRLADAMADGDGPAVLEAGRVADSLHAAAAEADPSWARPPAMRAFVAARLAVALQDDPRAAEQRLVEGGLHAVEALSRQSRFAPAMEAQGLLGYYRWGLGLVRDPAEAERLLAGAEEDLRAAVRQDPSRADAWNVLSVISSQKPDLVQAKLDAQRAYEADAFLRAADDLLWRLYATSYDLEQFPDAIQYCDEGRRRFPDDARFVECELWLLASRARDQDGVDRVGRAWQLQQEYVDRVPPAELPYYEAQSRIIVGGVLARAGLPDSADAVFRAARPTPAVDPSLELLGVEAVFRLQMGEEDEALNLLRRYLTTSPEHRSGWRWSSHWWWRDLQGNPAFRDLIGTG